MTIPQAAEFVDEDGSEVDFLDAPGLESLARVIFLRHGPRFDYLQEARIVFLWKGDGGSSGSRATLGKCTKLSGLAKHFAQADFTIWLAADHCRNLQFAAEQVEALLFHELLHITVEVNKDGQQKLVIAPHDLEVFLEEIREYGLWSSDLARLKQLPLFGESEEARDAAFEATSAQMDAQIAEFSAAVRERRPASLTVVQAGQPDFDANLAKLDEAIRSQPLPGEPHYHFHDDNPERPRMVCRDADCTLPHYPVEEPAAVGARV